MHVSAFLLPMLAPAAIASEDGAAERPAVIVTVENFAPENGTFQTPVWVGFHGGGFDVYDAGAPADSDPVSGSEALERLSEDGIVDSPEVDDLTEDFASLVPRGSQGVVASNDDVPPFAPGEIASRLFDVDPTEDRFFSYASMVVPSNDAFLANGSPTAHATFDAVGTFLGAPILVPGSAVLDAGTELNDEVPANTAFFGQMAPDTGVETSGTVAPHPGFLPAGSGGILDDPQFASADFLAPGYETLSFEFLFVDRADFYDLQGLLEPEQEVQTPPVVSDGEGIALARLAGDRDALRIAVVVRQLTGPVTAAHLHVGPAGQNGDIVVDLGDSILEVGVAGALIEKTVDPSDVIGPLGETDAPFDALFAELLTQGIYVNVHTDEYPAGEVRAQLVPVP